MIKQDPRRNENKSYLESRFAQYIDEYTRNAMRVRVGILCDIRGWDRTNIDTAFIAAENEMRWEGREPRKN